MIGSIKRSPSGEEARGRVLERFLETLRVERGQSLGSTGGPVAEPTTEAWTRRKLDVFFDRSAAPDTSSMLVAHGMALLAKCSDDLSSLQQLDIDSGVARYAAQAELMLDTAVGSALCRETQAQINFLLKEGAIEDARHLSQFHHSLRNAVFGIRRSISHEDETQADSLVDQLTLIRAGKEPTESSPPEIPNTRPATAKKAESQARRRRPAFLSESPVAVPASPGARTRGLAAALLISSVVWLGNWLPGTIGEESLPIDPAAVDPSGALKQVEDRRPSLFAVVDSAAWAGMSDGEREEWAQGVFRRVTPLGYGGGLIRDDRERPVARWFQGRGVALVGSEEDPPREEPDPPEKPTETAKLAASQPAY